jgi:TIR domain
MGKEIKEHLNTSQIILLMVSPDFMASDYCYGIEMKQAMEKHNRGDAVVIPIILRPVYFQGAPFGKLQALPTDAKPVMSSSWQYEDEAFYNVTEGIRKTVEKISRQSMPRKPQLASLSKGTQSGSTCQQTMKDQYGEPDLEALKNQFHQAMVNICIEARKIGYYAKEFFHMVNEYGGVETAHQLVAKDVTSGFTKLWELKRLDLSTEALILKPEFAALFNENERQKARKRLADYRYKAPWDS